MAELKLNYNLKFINQNIKPFDSSDGEVDFSPMVTLIKGIGLSVLSAVLSVALLYLIFLIVRVGFRIAHAAAEGDTEGKAKAVKDLLWIIFGFVIIMTATVVAGVFGGIFINDYNSNS
ncbi:hypothetical protein [Spiroplasma endosymbiont of Labia minor]|uniref:hypothetical protein n=1 Tax=Spiroplasma endosymbiont of Labia minor TaxID=3066305 RepID=UPI0030CB1E11